MAQKAAGAEVLHLALTSAVEKMHEAADLLEHRQPGGETQHAQQAALKWLDEVLEALKKDPQASRAVAARRSRGSARNSRREHRTRGRALRNFVQIKLVKLMQLDVNVRAGRRRQKALQGGVSGERGPQAIGRVGRSARPVGRPAPEAVADRRRSRSAGGPTMDCRGKPAGFILDFGFWILDCPWSSSGCSVLGMLSARAQTQPGKSLEEQLLDDRNARIRSIRIADRDLSKPAGQSCAGPGEARFDAARAGKSKCRWTSR